MRGRQSSEYLDEVARIEAQADKTKEQREAEVTEFVIKSMPPNIFQGALSSHPPIHDRIARLYALLHQSDPAGSPEEILAKRKAAAKIVADVTRTNPDLMATLQADSPLFRALGVNQAANPSDSAEPSAHDPVQTPAGDPTYANPSDQAAYQKLYEYNLGLDKSADHPLGSRSPFEPGFRGQSPTIDPAQLRAALALGMASMHKKSAAAPASIPGERPPSRKLRYLFWLVIALSAGAIIASFAIR
jgi:hypothetical protein